MRPFSQVDVFTDEFTRGNPVAVVHEADGLSDDELAAFANWTNLSETTFLLPPTDPAADYRVRIFTTSRELPFAGHPTLGSARAWLEAGGRPHADGRIVQECGVGLVRIRRTGQRLAFAAPPLLRSGPVDPATLVRIRTGLGLRAEQVLDAQWVDNGPGWVGLLVPDAETVLSVNPEPLPWLESGGEPILDVGVIGAHPSGAEVDFEVRAFFAGGEDPVTGSLNAALAQWLIGSGRAPERYRAAQGTRLGRRGRVHVERTDGEIWVGGDTVVGVSGTVAL